MNIKNKNLIKQQYDYSCGAASLATLFTYYLNTKVDENDVLDYIFEKKNLEKKKQQKIEISFLDLANFSESKGFKALALGLDFDTLLQIKIPVILYLMTRKSPHFSVFIGTDKKFIYLVDPSLGNIKIRIQKFKEMFAQRDTKKHSGSILAILPKDEGSKTRLKEPPKNHEEIFQEAIKNQMIHPF
ncbi:C39 family peptidase [Helicobacter mustelae]|uniref:C39 family peptidase n=1 Tax=Helicobacter mustelae TaxID=217 RepID=UPI002852EA6D|nr:C39 family peptidase [Helicobacter mustelae]